MPLAFSPVVVPARGLGNCGPNSLRCHMRHDQLRQPVLATQRGWQISMRVPVAVSMMQVRIVGMPVHQRCMAMPVHMRLARRVGRRVFVLMVNIVAVAMLVLHRFMNVVMLVLLRQMQP